MGYKGAKYTKCIEVPLFVLNIALLYAFLLTVSHLLAWLTIARHEQTIEGLKEILKQINEKEKEHWPSGAQRGDDEEDTALEGSNMLKLLAGQENAGQERSRRHMDSSSSNNNSQHSLKGLKGDRGEKGDKGDQGRVGRDGRDGLTGPQGKRGERGDIGMQGPRGYQGPQGVAGSPGVRGEKGSNGSMGLKGDRGNNGLPGKAVRHLHSAHIVASGKAIRSERGNKVISPKVKWRTQYRTGKMHYNNGYLTIGTDGVYFVYCQMYYFDGVSAYIGYEVYLDDKKILKAVHSVASKTRKYQTQYTSGIFEVSKGQKISIESPFAKYYYFNETLSYFGAFILQEKTANGN